MEIWKDIVEFEGYYQVSNLGRIKALPKIVKNKKYKERILNPYKKSIYYTVCLYKNNCKGIKVLYCKTVHRLVAITFIPNSNKELVVDHIDCDKSNNKVENLEWVSQKVNAERARQKGRYKLGEKQVTSKLK